MVGMAWSQSQAARMWQTSYDINVEGAMIMQLGAASPLCRSWQQFLVDEQLLSAADLQAAGGLFDAATARASKAFQVRAGLPADGVVGPRTLDAARDRGYSGVALTSRYTLLYGLRSGAFDDWEHPAALVYAPPGFDPRQPAVVVYLHGLDNNVENVVRAEPLSSDYPVADLLGQLDRSERNALLIVPELGYNAQRSDPGRLGEPGALRALLAEVLAKPAPPLGELRVEQLRWVVLLSHSAGFRAAAPMALGGGVRVDELGLLDSLYGQADAFTNYLLATLGETPPARRLISLYTGSGTTAELSRALAERAQAQAQRQQLPPATVVTSDESLAPEEFPQLPGARVLIQRVAAAHSDIPQRFVGPILAHGGLPVLGKRR
jgi:hypothetical protein